MSYSIHITRTAENDIDSAANYIEYVLMNQQAADDLLKETEDRIKGLSTSPQKYALVDDPVLRAWGIRFLTAGSYLIFYMVSKEEKTVYAVRFLNARRNWISILKHGFSLK